MTVTTKRSIIALLLSLVLVVSLFTIGVSATDETAPSSETEISSVEESATEKESEKESGTEKGTETSTSKETSTEEATESAAVKEKRTSLIVNGVIIGVIILIIVILVIRFRVKLGNFLRSVKSELKKIVWSSKENTRKGFLVVVIVAVAVAIAIGLIDFAFNTGISFLADLFN